MTKLIVAVAIAIAYGQGLSQPAPQKPEVYEIQRPTVIAFFALNTVKAVDESEEAGRAEVGSDFSYYASVVREPLRHAGIDFRISEAPSFQIRNKKLTLNYQASKLGVGYLFIAPGRRPRLIKGVTTDNGLIEQARDYFRIAIR